MADNSTTQPGINKLIIDVETHGAKEVYRMLKCLKSTTHIENCGQYRNCMEWSQIGITTRKTESELDAWIYNTKFSKYFNANVCPQRVD